MAPLTNVRMRSMLLLVQYRPLTPCGAACIDNRAVPIVVASARVAHVMSLAKRNSRAWYTRPAASLTLPDLRCGSLTLHARLTCAARLTRATSLP